MIPDQYPNYYKALEIYTGYLNSLDIMIFLSYPSSIVITRDYCTFNSYSRSSASLNNSFILTPLRLLSVTAPQCLIFLF